MQEVTIAFLGGGNMARSLIGGLIADGHRPDRIWVADPDPRQRERLAAGAAVHTTDDNVAAVERADVVVLAVKPQQLRGVALGIGPAAGARRPLMISIAAGVGSADLDRWLGGGLPLVRCMPNTPALVGSGATALYATAATGEDQREVAESILRAVGLTLWVRDEALLDAVTAISGSGPAYFFLLMEALEQAARSLGLDGESARLLTRQTAFGAAKLALESAEEIERLRERVTSPGGTTERALAVLEQGDLRGLVRRAAAAAEARSRELAEDLGKD